jgi:hypothetical protein
MLEQMCYYFSELIAGGKQMSTITLLALLLIAQSDSAAAPVQAPPANPWQKTVEASLMTTQNAYSNSWSGGEAGSISWAANGAFTAQKQYNPKLNHKNSAKLSFGQTVGQDETSKRWNRPAKSTDLIDLESLLRLTLGLAVDPYAAVRLETQFRDAGDPGNLRSFNPALFSESFGAARSFYNDKDRELTVRLGLSAKEKVDRNVMIDPVNVIRATATDKSGGLEFITDFRMPVFSPKVRYAAKLSVYKAFYNSNKNKLAGLPNQDYWKAADVNWENALTASVSKYLMVAVYVQLLYDKETDLRARLKETLSLGLTYSRK